MCAMRFRENMGFLHIHLPLWVSRWCRAPDSIWMPLASRFSVRPSSTRTRQPNLSLDAESRDLPIGSGFFFFFSSTLSSPSPPSTSRGPNFRISRRRQRTPTRSTSRLQGRKAKLDDNFFRLRRNFRTPDRQAETVGRSVDRFFVPFEMCE